MRQTAGVRYVNPHVVAGGVPSRPRRANGGRVPNNGPPVRRRMPARFSMPSRVHDGSTKASA
ncbi:hypothetical protein, partial [Mycolicibacterium fortuitum]|uniref:hypothetical protein n=1 Tax=Mycolicibacterium fortuitum TaxID=1766 RepID=UPI001A97C5B4